MKLCSDADKDELLLFLKENASLNCFFIGDIENFQLTEPFINVWCSYVNNKINTVLLRYYNHYLITAKNFNDCESASNIILNDKKCISISGEEKLLDKVNEYIKVSSIKRLNLAELNIKTFNDFPLRYKVEQAEVKDIEALFQFQKSIEEFDLSDDNRESFGKEVISKTGRMCFIKENNRIVASATITAENSINGMIIGVATDKGYRNKGYALTCVSTLCKNFIVDNKQVILFYNNPDAGKLYKKIGFKDIGRWAIGNIKK